jgi:hypothetical protein
VTVVMLDPVSPLSCAGSCLPGEAAGGCAAW